MTILTIFTIAVVTFAYLAVGIMFLGSFIVVLRWIFKKKGPTNTYLGYPNLFTYPGQNTRLQAVKNMLSRMLLFSSAKDDPFVRYTGLAFHWSLWIIILAHSDLILMPYFAAAGVSEITMEAIGAYLGTTLAFVMVGSGLMLVGRRVLNPYLRKISNASDYFSILLIVGIGITGILMRFILPADFAYAQVSPFILSLFSFAPIAVPYAPIFIVHFLLTLTLLAYLPLSKLVHPYAFFTSPTICSISHQGEVQ